MRHPIYSICIINKRALFHFWWKQNWVKFQKISEYYENDCLQNIGLFFMSLWKAPIVKHSRLNYILLFLLKNHVKTNLKIFQYRFSMSGKISLKQLASEANSGTILQLSCSKFSLKLWEKPDIYQNCQKVKFEGALNEFEAKILRQTLVLMWNSALWNS